MCLDKEVINKGLKKQIELEQKKNKDLNERIFEIKKRAKNPSMDQSFSTGIPKYRFYNTDKQDNEIAILKQQLALL